MSDDVIMAGDWKVSDKADMVRITMKDYPIYHLTHEQARELWQALNVWVERNAEVVE